MQKKTAYITGMGDLKNSPSLYPLYRFEYKTEQHQRILPCHWSSFEYLFQTYDEIIIVGNLCPDDRLFQGEPSHFTEMMLVLFHLASNQFSKQVFILENKELQPLKSVMEGNLTQTAQHLNNHTSVKKGKENTVTSIQKYRIKNNFTAEEWALHYFEWIHQFTLRLITVKVNNASYSFHIIGLSKPLLYLKQMPGFKNKECVEIEINGGLLNKKKEAFPTGRFWFVKNGDFLYTALVHFKPALPWIPYRLSQGWIHAVVMRQFGKKIYLQESSGEH